MNKNQIQNYWNYRMKITSETASVYTEIGLQVGMLLMKDMLENVGRERQNESRVSKENPVVSNAIKHS